MTASAPQRRGLCEKTVIRRREVIRLLRAGRMIHGETLRQAVMPDRSMNNLYLLIRRLREAGYGIETNGTGWDSRGYRLVSEPA